MLHGVPGKFIGSSYLAVRNRGLLAISRLHRTYFLLQHKNNFKNGPSIGWSPLQEALSFAAWCKGAACSERNGTAS